MYMLCIQLLLVLVESSKNVCIQVHKVLATPVIFPWQNVLIVSRLTTCYATAALFALGNLHCSVGTGPLSLCFQR